jgi:hypothetical protein
LLKKKGKIHPFLGRPFFYLPESRAPGGGYMYLFFLPYGLKKKKFCEQLKQKLRSAILFFLKSWFY